MKKSVGRQIVGLALVSLLLSFSSVYGWTYEQDFSSYPGEWVTSDPSRCYWRGHPYYDFHLEHANESGHQTYTTLDYSPSAPFILEFDINIARVDWSSGASLGLWDQEMRYDTYSPEAGSSYVQVAYGRGDHGLCVLLLWVGEDRVKRGVDQYPSPWSYSTWYHNRLEYDPAAGRCHLEVTEGKGGGGALLADLVLEGLVGDALLAADVSRLGNTGLGDWAVAGAGSAYQIDNLQFSTVPVPVTIDIKPGSEPNSINLGAKGVVPVAILTTPDFEAASVDAFSLTLSGAPVRVKGKSGHTGSMKDVDGDGDLDLIVQFRIDELVLEQGATEAVLEGFTFDGIPIIGFDWVNVVP